MRISVLEHRLGAVARGVVAGVVAIALVVVLVSRFQHATSSARKLASVPDPQIGHLAPDFTFTLWNGASPQQQVHLNALRGSPIVVNFWATWCDPCRAEAPILASAFKSYSARGVQFLGVAFQSSPADARAFMAQYNIAYPCGPAPDALASEYGLTGLPVTLVINRSGVVTQKFMGQLQTAPLDHAIEAALA
ncbi:MAG TPA: TlpA disulfide reductase family protein [Ktedonobacterales bacterium]|nr:TlpA disulfide reductase family protein [Ktedonobacterales bacterium]